MAGLTPEQTQAVCHGPGVLLIVAGPGAGKTKTLIHRIAFLLAQGLAEPREVLAVTFSVRAASELRLRLSELLGEQLATQVTAATFHSICARLLREHAQLFGRRANWTVYDQVEVRRVVDWLLSERQRTAIQQGLADFGQPAASEVLHEISLAKNRLLDPDSYERSAGHPAAPLIAAVWRETEAELRRSNAVDFDDLLVCAVRLLAEHPHYLELYRRRWRWIVVDEYQDTCQAQAVLVSLLAGPDGNLCCVSGRRPVAVRVPGRRRARARPTRRALPGTRADRAGAQLPLPRRDPGARRTLHTKQLRPRPQDADRDARRRRTRGRVRVRLRPRRGLLERRDDRPGARGGHTPRGDPAAGAHRLRDRARADRTGGAPASPTGCSAPSACTSAPRCATRSPT